MLKSFATVNCHELFSFLKKEKKKLIIFLNVSLQTRNTLYFSIIFKKIHTQLKRIFCVVIFSSKILPPLSKKQNLSTTFKAFSVCSPSHTFYEKKAQYFSAIFSAIFENFGAHYSSTFYCPPSIYNLFTLIAPQTRFKNRKKEIFTTTTTTYHNFFGKKEMKYYSPLYTQHNK